MIEEIWMENKKISYIQWSTLQTNHGGEGQIQLTLLVQLCDLVAPSKHVCYSQ